MPQRSPIPPPSLPVAAAREAQLIALAEIAQLLRSTDDAPTRVQRALERLCEVVPYDRCTLSCPQGEQTRIYAVPTPPREEREEPVAALAALFVQDGEADDASYPRVHSHLAVPLVAHDKARGVLLVERHSGAPYDEDALRRLSIVSALLGAYVAHCEAVAENGAPTQERDALLLPRDLVLTHRDPEPQPSVPVAATGEAQLIALAEIAQLLQSMDDAPTRVQRAIELLREVVPYDRCTLSWSQGEQTTIYGVPAPREESEQIVASLATLLVHEGEGPDKSLPFPHSHLAVPLVVLDEARGVLLVERDSGAPYGESALRRLSIVSAQLGAYVAQCEAIAETRERGQERDTLLASAQLANRAKDEFMAMLGHELRNPLSPILTASHLLRLRGVQGGERERAIIERQALHLSRLLEDLLDVSRVTRGTLELKKERVEVSEIVARAVETASPVLEQKRHHLRVNVARSGLAVIGDVARLAQVISNLLINAGKFTGASGQIAIEAVRRGADIVIQVTDNGAGITPELLPRVFELFVQEQQSLARSQGGLGLGLAIVRRIVDLHGGAAWAESKGLGHGSTFTVSLPACADQRIDAVETAPASISGFPKEAKSRLRVLVVDDNEDAAEIVGESLEAVGYAVQTAPDGPTALRIVENFLPDVALLDIGLPLMNGYELARRLREREGPGLRLVAVTGYGQEKDRARALDAGFDAHLVKPVDLVELTEVIARLTEGAAQGS